MKYQVGNLINYADDDPVFDDRQEAIEWAQTLSERDYEGFVGLWASQDDGGELLAIFHAGEGYWS